MPFRDVRNMYMNAWMILLFSLACQYSCDLDLYVKSSMILTWQMRMNTMHERYSGIKRYLIYNLVFVRLHTIHGATMRCQNEHHTIQLSTQAQIPILVLRWCNHMSRIQETKTIRCSYVHEGWTFQQCSVSFLGKRCESISCHVVLMFWQLRSTTTCRSVPGACRTTTRRFTTCHSTMSRLGSRRPAAGHASP